MHWLKIVLSCHQTSQEGTWFSFDLAAWYINKQNKTNGQTNKPMSQTSHEGTWFFFGILVNKQTKQNIAMSWLSFFPLSFLFVFSLVSFVFFVFFLSSLYFYLFFHTILWSSVWKVSSVKSHSLCQNSKVAPSHWLTKVMYRAARAAKNTLYLIMIWHSNTPLFEPIHMLSLRESRTPKVGKGDQPWVVFMSSIKAVMVGTWVNFLRKEMSPGAKVLIQISAWIWSILECGGEVGGGGRVVESGMASQGRPAAAAKGGSGLSRIWQRRGEKSSSGQSLNPLRFILKAW